MVVFQIQEDQNVQFLISLPKSDRRIYSAFFARDGFKVGQMG
jgi:hypothetical protein